MGIKYRKDSTSEWLEIKGLDGSQGPKGEAGYSPVKGVDYWTKDDKQEIIDEIPPTDLTGYATEEYVSQKIAEAELNEKEVDLSAYYTKSETDVEIDKAVAAIPQPDLSGYALKTDIPMVPTNVSDFTNDVGYALKTEIPSTAGLATKEYVDGAVKNVEVDLTGYATETYVDEKVANVDVDLTGYAKTDDLAKVATSGSYNDLEDLPDGAINVSPVPGGDIWIDTSGGDVIGFADVAFSGDYNHLVNRPSMDGFASEDYVNLRIAEAQLADKDVDLSAYYTKGETRDVINEKLVNYYTRIETEDRISVALRDYAMRDEVEAVAGQLDQVKADSATTEYVDEKIAAIPQPDLTSYALQSELDYVIENYVSNYYAENNLATKLYVSDVVEERLTETQVEINKTYALKSEIPSTTGFITMPEVEAKGYQTLDQVNTLITNAQLGDDKDIDLSNYYTKAETRAYINNDYYTKAVTDNLITNNVGSLRNEIVNNYITKTTVENNYAKKSDIPNTSGFTTITEVKALGYQTEAQVLALIRANLPTSAEGVKY